jgi:hypothetical protein
MSRDIPAAVAAELQAPTLRPAILFEGEFATGWVRVWTGLGPLFWRGVQWTGLGTLIGVGGIDETSEVVANGTAVSLSGVPLDLIGIAIDEARQGRPGRIFLAVLTPAGALIDEPVQLFAGRLDVPEIEEGAETCTVTISYESRMLDLTTPREWRYTHESQQVLYPGDRGLEYVTSIQELELRA